MRWMRLTVSFGLSLLFLYLTFFKPEIGSVFAGREGLADALFGHLRFDLAQLGEVIASADWVPIGFAGILFFASLALRAWRWRIMLAPIVKMSFGEVFSAMCVGYMANNVLPLRMGEVYRAHVVHEISGLSRTAAFGAVVLERVTDILFMLPYMALAIVLYPLPGVMQTAAYLVAIAAFVMTGFLVWIVLDRARALALAERVLSIFPHRLKIACMKLLDKFTSGLSVLGESRHLPSIIISSLLLWAMYAGMQYGVLRALHFMDSGITAIDSNPLGAVLVLLIITTIGFAIPSAPGAVGTYHGVAVLGLSLFGVTGDKAAGFAIMMHGLNYIPLTVLGLVFFWKLGLTFKETKQLATDNDLSSDESSAIQGQRPLSPLPERRNGV